MLNIQGLVVIDVDVAALNNAGSEKTAVSDNATVTKKIRRNGKQYPYISGQAWRYWWRETLENSFKWKLSPITRDSKIAYTKADPIEYSDDDIFGYMRAAKAAEGGTLTRNSPLKNSALIGVGYNPIAHNFSVMGRSDGDPVPYGKDEYSAVLKGLFSLSADQIGTFSDSNRTGYKNINEALIKKAKENRASEIQDPYNSAKTTKLFRLPIEIRKKRIEDTLKALKVISGGAKLTTNYADVTPKLIVLVKMKSANHPFSHIIKEELDKPVFSIKALEEIIFEYHDFFEEKVYIGKREGFMDELNEELKKMNDEGKIVFGLVNKIIDSFTQSVLDIMD
jgi:CRISPR-associated protein Cst2